MAIDTQIGLRAFANLNDDIRNYYKSYLFVMFSSHGVSGVLFNLYMLRLGLSPAAIGIVNGAGLIVFALFAFPAGLLGRRIPMGTILRLGIVVFFLGMAIKLIAESLTTVLLLPALVFGVMLEGIGGTLYIVCSYPLLMGCKPENKNRVFSFRFAIEIIGSFAGSVIAGILPSIVSRLFDLELDSSVSYRVSLALILPLLLIAYRFVCRVRGTTISRRTTNDTRKIANFKNAVLPIVFFSLFTLLFTMGRQSVRTFYNVYLDNRFTMPTHVIGTVMGLAKLLGIPAAALSAALNRRFGPWKVLLGGLIAFVITILALAKFDSPVAALAGYVAFSAAIAVTSPARDLYSQSVVAPEYRSVMSGAFNAAYGLGGSTIVFVGGFMITSLGFARLFTLAAVITSAAILVLVVFLPVSMPASDAEEKPEGA